MKIYINHFNLNILPDLLKTLSNYHIKSEEYMQLYSTSGIYMIDQTSSIKLNQVDHDIVLLKNFYQDFTLIVDPSFYIAEKVVNIPPEHITTKIKRDVFALHNNNKINTNKKNHPNIKLIIETEIKSEPEEAFYFLNKNKTDNEDNYRDMFFEMPNGTNVNDALVKEEIIEFLSLLN
jgi:hypothetical protein